MESWKATAKLRWFAGGHQVGEEHLSFEVECPELPQDDRLDPEGVRRLVTLQLVYADTRARYGTPPLTVDIQVAEDEPAIGPNRARWRSGSGFCYGTGIMQVAPPPPEARLVDLKIMESKPMGTDLWRVTAFGVAGTEFMYEVEAASESEALDEAYGAHGRRYKDGEVSEYLGTRASVTRLGEDKSEAE